MSSGSLTRFKFEKPMACVDGEPLSASTRAAAHVVARSRSRRADSRRSRSWPVWLALAVAYCLHGAATPVAAEDPMRQLQAKAIAEDRAAWGHWGLDPKKYTGWKSHSNRLIPIYTFGISLDGVAGEHSPYRSEEELQKLYGRVPERTLNPKAGYFDQTGVYKLQQAAVAAGKKYVVLMVFDGMDWQTTWAAATYRNGKVAYREGRGSGNCFQDYRGVTGDFGYFVSSPFSGSFVADPNKQTAVAPKGVVFGGYDWRLAGADPWTPGEDLAYLISKSEQRKQAYTDSAASATSMTAGVKSYNDAINVDSQGKQVEPIARQLQRQGYSVGVVTSVPISHATPAAAYANNVTRDDYQDLTRDLLGLPSIAHSDEPLPGVDVLLGTGWGDEFIMDAAQGENFVPGNKYLAKADRESVDWQKGGKYQVVERTAGVVGATALADAARDAKKNQRRLFGFFGAPGPAGTAASHLPFRTADGGFNPAPGVRSKADPSVDPRTGAYFEANVTENPTLADMASAALDVLAANPKGFWLMIEAGDVDWANHDDNLDNSIGAVFSGDDAFRAVTQWAEKNDCWDETVVIVTADHGHLLVLDDPEAIAAAGKGAPASGGR